MYRQGPALPNLVIIGAAKCGTTSLHRYLDQHPDVQMSAVKELNFFRDPDWYDKVEEYTQHFDASAEVRGESSPLYTLYPHERGPAARMAHLIPDAKLIYLVRDPVDRVLAYWTELYSVEEEHRSIEEVLEHCDHPENKYVCPSRYALQIEEYLRHFPSSALLVVDQQDLLNDRRRTLKEIFDFLGVDPDFDSPVFDVRLNSADQKRRVSASYRTLQGTLVRVGARHIPQSARGVVGARLRSRFSSPVERPEIAPELHATLRELLKPDADRLREITGKEFSDWCV